jgi:Photosynthetic reaction centre cytochrome C subunit
MFALAAAAGTFAFSVAAAQTSPPAVVAQPAPGAASFKNLQVFPKDISRQQLFSNMRFFTQSLGVHCTFCHVGVEGQPPSTYDFASDAKKEKLFARRMLMMVQRINTQDFGVQPWAGNAKVTCFTCHRGSERPLTAPPPPTPAAVAPPATPSAPSTRPVAGAV